MVHHICTVVFWTQLGVCDFTNDARVKDACVRLSCRLFDRSFVYTCINTFVRSQRSFAIRHSPIFVWSGRSSQYLVIVCRVTNRSPKIQTLAVACVFELDGARNF